MRQDFLLDEVVVQGFEKLPEKLHDAAIVLAEHDAALAGIQAQHVDALAQDFAQAARADRQPFGIEGRAARDNAKTLAKQEQRQAVADLGAGRDFPQRNGLVHGAGVDQGQFGELRPRGIHDLGLGRIGQRGQGIFDAVEHRRCQQGAVGMDLLLGFQQGALNLVAAGLFGAAENLLLQLGEHQLERTGEIASEMTQQTLQQRALAACKTAVRDSRATDRCASASPHPRCLHIRSSTRA